MISILLFIALITFLILIHELGHFFVALWCKVKIEEFGIGLPPKAATLFKWRGIPFTLNWTFLGGFVRMEGEEAGSIEEKKENTSHNHGYPFFTRPLLQKLAIVAAGPLVNFAFGIVLFSILFSIYGIPEKILSVPTIEVISEQSPAQQAALQPKDQVTQIKQKNGTVVLRLSENKELIDFLAAHRGETVVLTIQRENTTKDVEVYSRTVAETPSGQGGLGIQLASQYESKFYPGLEQLVRGTIVGVKQSLDFGVRILESLAGLGKSLTKGAIPSDLSGPVGIARQAEKEKVFASGFGVAANFAALLSINLAIMNLLPIPALDGGRIVLLIVEKFVPGKKFQLVSQWLNTTGFVLLLSLLLLITLKDVLGIFFS